MEEDQDKSRAVKPYIRKQKTEIELQIDSLYDQATKLQKDDISLAIEKMREANALVIEHMTILPVFKMELLPKILLKAGRDEEAQAEKEKIIELSISFRRKKIEEQWKRLSRYEGRVTHVEIRPGVTPKPCPYHKDMWKVPLVISEDTWENTISKLCADDKCRCWFTTVLNRQDAKQGEEGEGASNVVRRVTKTRVSLRDRNVSSKHSESDLDEQSIRDDFENQSAKGVANPLSDSSNVINSVTKNMGSLEEKSKSKDIATEFPKSKIIIDESVLKAERENLQAEADSIGEEILRNNNTVIDDAKIFNKSRVSKIIFCIVLIFIGYIIFKLFM